MLNNVPKRHVAIAVLVLVVLVAGSAGHTVLITNGYTLDLYERARDVAITAIGVFFLIYHLRQMRQDKKHAVYYLVIACMFTMIATVHTLRFFCDGLLC
ncbi:hypothetical protein ACFL2M_02035 [Patescibacteria group bacterium]